MKSIILIFITTIFSFISFGQKILIPFGSGISATLTCTVCATWDTSSTRQGTSVTLINNDSTVNVPITTTGGRSGFANAGVSSGKWYWEIRWNVGGAPYMVVGIGQTTMPLNTYPGNNSVSWGYLAGSGSSKRGGGGGERATYGASWVAGDIIGIALDMDNGAIYFRKNGVWQGGGVPTSGNARIGSAFTSPITGTVYPTWGSADGSGTTAQLTANFGNRPFRDSPPSGYNYGIF